MLMIWDIYPRDTCHSVIPRSITLINPWRCLWRGSVQITRTTPLRLMILQLRQIHLTDARTFMFALFPLVQFNA